MFRRKEEGLFDAATDQNQMHDESEQAESTSQPATTSFGTSTAGSASSTHSASTTAPVTGASSASMHPAAATVAPRPNPAPPTANSFRPAASNLTSDLSRNRMPEAKAQPAAAAAATSATSSTAIGEKTKGGKRVLTVGNDILLKGEIATCDRLVIEGKVDATLNDVHTVEIAECGSFKGSAQIEDAEISGLFEGDLTVRGRLVIYATGKVRGKISYGEIEIERGGELTGEIKIAGASSTSSRPARNSQKEEKVAA
jgi:cytoskeletal protein CcmA (bactofilin family)